MGAIFIWLSGASREILAECPTEWPRFFGLGAAILVTGAMAATSLSFALADALSVRAQYAVVFAVLWGLAIMMVDRMFVVSMHRQQNPLIYLIQALPRLLMAVVLGLVISTPFVLRIFKPEITNEVQQLQAAQREAYFKGLPTNPVYVTRQRDLATVNLLKTQAATGGPGIDISADPTLASLNSQLSTAQQEVNYWTGELNCQLYGGTANGTTCSVGYGPVGHNDQAEITTWQDKVTTLNEEIANRTHLLQHQSAQQQGAARKSATDQLKAAEQALSFAQQQLDLQTQNITSGIKQNDGILEQLKALDDVTQGNFTLQAARMLLFLLFLFVDIMPVFAKLLMNLMPPGPYDQILAGEEDTQARNAEVSRAVRRALHQQITQAQADGMRYRVEALSSPLPGQLRESIVAMRLRTEKAWLLRLEAERMHDIAHGHGLGNSRPAPYAASGANGSLSSGSVAGQDHRTGQPAVNGSVPPVRPGPRPRWTWHLPRWAWLAALILPRWMGLTAILLAQWAHLTSALVARWAWLIAVFHSGHAGGPGPEHSLPPAPQGQQPHPGAPTDEQRFAEAFDAPGIVTLVPEVTVSAEVTLLPSVVPAQVTLEDIPTVPLSESDGEIPTMPLPRFPHPSVPAETFP